MKTRTKYRGSEPFASWGNRAASHRTRRGARPSHRLYFNSAPGQSIGILPSGVVAAVPGVPPATTPAVVPAVAAAAVPDEVAEPSGGLLEDRVNAINEGFPGWVVSQVGKHNMSNYQKWLDFLAQHPSFNFPSVRDFNWLMDHGDTAMFSWLAKNLDTVGRYGMSGFLPIGMSVGPRGETSGPAVPSDSVPDVND